MTQKIGILLVGLSILLVACLGEQKPTGDQTEMVETLVSANMIILQATAFSGNQTAEESTRLSATDTQEPTDTDTPVPSPTFTEVPPSPSFTATVIPPIISSPTSAPVSATENGNSTSGDNCHPSYPDKCLASDKGDYDCEGGSGDGPNYVKGPIRVLPPDPFNLDNDGDGIGCKN